MFQQNTKSVPTEGFYVLRLLLLFIRELHV